MASPEEGIEWTISDEEQRANVERKRRDEQQRMQEIIAQHELRAYPKHKQRKHVRQRHQPTIF